MSGVAVIRAKLVAYITLTAIVPAARIRTGKLDLGIAIPAISVTMINGEERNNVAMTTTGRMHTDLVRVTAIVSQIQTSAAGTGYPGLSAILNHILAACPHTRGTVAGINVDSIVPAGRGPDLPTDAPEWISATRDFVVRWTS